MNDFNETFKCNNKEIRALLTNQLDTCKQLLGTTERALKRAPDGRLRVCESKNRIQYYHCLEDDAGKYKNGTYLSKKNRKLAETLAQKDYNKAVQKQLREECFELERFLKCYSEHDLEDLRESLCKGRRALISAYTLDDEEYRNYWTNSLYPESKCRRVISDHDTNRGECVRSKSEKIIADELFRRDILYRYEYPLIRRDGVLIHPDFTVLNLRTRKTYLWEHCGLMSSEDYVAKLSERMIGYAESGFFPGENIIMTFECETKPLSTQSIMQQIEHYLL